MGAVEGWERRLLAELDRWQGLPFAWGRADCWDFCRACERAVTGASRFDDLPGYTTAAGAVRQLKGLGFDTASELVDSRLPVIPPLMARRGDWAMQDTSALHSFGVVIGRRIAYRTDTGLAYLPLATAQRAWRIA